MISDARRGHVSPGIYTEEKDVTYSVKSLGITSLGLVGETLYGPAFENIEIENWGEFVDYFGGTSTAKFRNGLPKYELPYIAKSYLEESRRLNVVRVLGLSGYHAGPVWVLDGDDNKPLVILRSVMKYGTASNEDCGGMTEETTPIVTAVTVSKPSGNVKSACGDGTSLSNFALKVDTTNGSYTYNVSLNKGDTDYIYNVLGTSPETSKTPVYIDAVYERSGVDLKAGAAAKKEDATVTKYEAYTTSTTASPTEESENKWVWSWDYSSGYSASELGIDETSWTITSSEPGTTASTQAAAQTAMAVKYYKKTDNFSYPKAYDNYMSMYRCAITPWFVSETAKIGNGYNVTELFRFYTISDGDASNYQVKVSIQNIDLRTGTFDVVVRDFNDDDNAPHVLERFSKCSLIEGDASYIAYKIGSVDGGYASKSKYIAVEMSDNSEDLSSHIPAGFLGYYIPDYGKGINNLLDIEYCTNIKADEKPKRVYFGLNSNNIDADMLSFKGEAFYNENFMSNGFHLDSRLNGETVTVNGAGKFKFTTVDSGKTAKSGELIINGTEAYQPIFIRSTATTESTMYKDVNTRKFTAYFYGGFDGWDVNRIYNGRGRSIDDFYKASSYVVGETSNMFEKWGSVIKRYKDNGLNLPLDLPSTATTADYYAFLAGYRVFANPQDVDINVFATPGIDWMHNRLLTEEALDVIEDADYGRGGDALYIMNAPRDLDADEVASEFEDSDIDTSYAATYAPWVMYYDASNKKYIELPVTKDVVRNMAKTDNESFPWFAPAGTQRGEVKCIKALQKTTLAEEDTLYEARVNPVKTFAQDGVKIWGNKTAYRRESPLNRVNVRRLMIRVKKLISDAAKHLIFEQYDDTLEKQFRGLVEPILADVKANRGIFDYRVITEVTPETRDQHILPAKILIKPTPALEYISISFVVYPESVSFEEN